MISLRRFSQLFQSKSQRKFTWHVAYYYLILKFFIFTFSFGFIVKEIFVNTCWSFCLYFRFTLSKQIVPYWGQSNKGLFAIQREPKINISVPKWHYKDNLPAVDPSGASGCKWPYSITRWTDVKWFSVSADCRAKKWTSVAIKRVERTNPASLSLIAEDKKNISYIWVNLYAYYTHFHATQCK